MNTLLILTLAGASLLLSDAVQPLAAGYNSRCVCVSLESRIIPEETLRRVEILPRGPHCKTTEVIADLSSGERICLNPKTTFVRKLIQFIERKQPVKRVKDVSAATF